MFILTKHLMFDDTYKIFMSLFSYSLLTSFLQIRKTNKKSAQESSWTEIKKGNRGVEVRSPQRGGSSGASPPAGGQGCFIA
jgi:hypothetical protein